MKDKEVNLISYKELFSGYVDISIETAASFLTEYPSSAKAFARLSSDFAKAESRRIKNTEEGIEIPPLMIVSTTSLCNLTCAGCYSCEQAKKPEEPLTEKRISELLDEASDLGISIMMLAGGEPLLSHGWLEAMSSHEEMLGLVFTNGTLIDKSHQDWFSAHRHMIPTFSTEGGREQTDARRGAGVHEKVTEAMALMKDARIPFGVSITVTSENIKSLLTNDFIDEYLQKGCKLFIFVEYVPVEPGSQPLVLTDSHKKQLSDFAQRCSKQYPALFIPFPGNEEEFGGCLAAGRGFINVSAEGALEPCPFAPFSDTNLKTTTLKNALASQFLSQVRANHHLLKEGEGGCALWNNREWLQELIV